MDAKFRIPPLSGAELCLAQNDLCLSGFPAKKHRHKRSPLFSLLLAATQGCLPTDRPYNETTTSLLEPSVVSTSLSLTPTQVCLFLTTLHTHGIWPTVAPIPILTHPCVGVSAEWTSYRRKGCIITGIFSCFLVVPQRVPLFHYLDEYLKACALNSISPSASSLGIYTGWVVRQLLYL